MKFHIEAEAAGARTAVRTSARIDADTDAGRFMAISTVEEIGMARGPKSEPGDGVRLRATLVGKRRTSRERAGDLRVGGRDRPLGRTVWPWRTFSYTGGRGSYGPSAALSSRSSQNEMQGVKAMHGRVRSIVLAASIVLVACHPAPGQAGISQQ